MRSTDHPQDDRLIIEALVHPGEALRETNATRAARAGQLAREIADEHGLDVADALYQISAIENTDDASRYSRSVDEPS